jgi:streptogramin lyase
VNFSALLSQRLCGIFLTALCASILGCGTNVLSTSSPSSLAGGQLRGKVHGGQQPIVGSSVQLYAAATTYGGSATPLLPSPVVTDSTGSFSITGDYACPSETSLLYIVATGGNSGSGPNPAIALMAALGLCSLHGSQLTLDPDSFIWINEVTTVASVYALAGFMGADATHLGTSSTNEIGLENSFQLVNNLVNTATGTALAVTPAGNGTAPQATINTLANIVASCVNSTGTGGACIALAAAATPSGGTAPTDTIQGVLNVARNPSNNVSTLFGLASAEPPFQPTLKVAPNDWTVALNYKGGGLNSPDAVSIDSLGDVWIGDNSSRVVELSSTGAVLSGPGGFTGGGISGPRGMAIDPSGDVWVANFFGNSVTKLDASGSILSGPGGFTNGIPGPNGPTFVAVDGTGNAWLTNPTAPSFTVTKLAGDGSLIADSLSPCATAATCQLEGPLMIAIDASEDVWIVNDNPGPGAVAKLNNSGAVLSGQSGFTHGVSGASFVAFDHSGDAWVTNFGTDDVTKDVAKLDNNGTLLASGSAPGLSEPVGIAIDGSGNAWVVSYSNATVVELRNDLTVLSGATGYVDSTPNPPIPGCTVPPAPTCVQTRISAAIAVDGSGNVWVTNNDEASISQFVGAATPVVTPLSVGVKNNTLGTRP